MGELDGGDLFVSQLTDCTVSVPDVTSAVRIDKVKVRNAPTCCAELLLIRTVGSILVRSLAQRTLKAQTIACSSLLPDKCACVWCAMVCNVGLSLQIRIHYATNCQFYLHVLSNPIIEDCSGLQFAPYSLRYDNLFDQLVVRRDLPHHRVHSACRKLACCRHRLLHRMVQLTLMRTPGTRSSS